MLTPQFQLPLHRELLVDLFAGGGGASTGIEQALGRHVDVAINHDPEAIALHTVNHPQAQGFPPNYIINHRDDGSPITKTAQVRMCGNSVCPPVAQALVAANYKPLRNAASRLKSREART